MSICQSGLGIFLSQFLGFNYIVFYHTISLRSYSAILCIYLNSLKVRICILARHGSLCLYSTDGYRMISSLRPAWATYQDPILTPLLCTPSFLTSAVNQCSPHAAGLRHVLPRFSILSFFSLHGCSHCALVPSSGITFFLLEIPPLAFPLVNIYFWINSPSFCLSEKDLYFFLILGRYFPLHLEFFWFPEADISLSPASVCVCAADVSCLSKTPFLLHLILGSLFKSLVFIGFSLVCPVTNFPLTRSSRATVNGSLEVGWVRAM